MFTIYKVWNMITIDIISLHFLSLSGHPSSSRFLWAWETFELIFHISKICQQLTFSPCPCLNHLSTMSHANQFQHLQQCDMKRHWIFFTTFWMHLFFGDTQGHARHWVPMSGTEWVSHHFFCDTHIVKPKKQVHARHWVPMSGTQWVSHPVFSDAPFFWEPTGACAPLGANVWHPMGVLGYTHFKAQKTGRRAPLGANVWHPMGVTPSFFWCTLFLGTDRCMRATGCQCLGWTCVYPKKGCDTHLVPDIGTQWRACTCGSPKKGCINKNWVWHPLDTRHWHPVEGALPLSKKNVWKKRWSQKIWVWHPFVSRHWHPVARMHLLYPKKNAHPQKIGAPKGDSDRGPLEASGWLSSCDPFLQLLFWLKLF